MKRPRDLFWRRAKMQVIDGPDGEIYLPTIYPPLQGGAEPTDALRLGRATDWLQIGENGPMRGVGAVTLVVGEEPKTWLEMGSLNFRFAT
jgi:type VI secretion system protein ImpE